MQPESAPGSVPPPPVPPPPGGGPPAFELEHAGGPAKRHGTPILIGAAVLLVLGAGSALGWFLLREPPIPSETEAATSFGTALGTGSFTGVPVFTETSAVPDEQYELIFAGMGEATSGLDVVVESTTPVEESDDGSATFTATYAWTWPLTEEEAWTYTTDVEFSYPGPDGRDAGAWEATWNPGVLVPELQSGERVVAERVAGERGRILGAGGETIVEEREVFTVGVDKTRIEDTEWESTAQALADMLDFPDDARDEFVGRTMSAGAKAFVQAIVIRENDPDYDVDALAAVDGILLIPGSRALAPTADFARPILGTTGKASAETIEKSEGRIEDGDLVGVSGIQRAYDERLRGSPGIQVLAEDSDSADSRELWATGAKPGKDVTLTLDVGMQQHAEQVLADSGEESPSAIVVVDGKSGAVLTAASGPGSQGYDTAMLGQYPPGSTFKVASALGMLRNGLTPDSTVQCPERIVVGKEFDNVDGYPTSALGDVPLSLAFAHSCNTAMVGQSDLVSQADLAGAAASLGLGGSVDGLGAAGYLGEVPAEATGEADHAASFIGQGRILASPLGMATVAASVAGGHTVSPTLLADNADKAGAKSQDGDLTEAEATTLRELMGGVVSVGSAKAALADVPGVIGAKTGSAEGNDGETNVWMLAVKGDIGVAVFVEDGDFGSTTAGPIMREFLLGG